MRSAFFKLILMKPGFISGIIRVCLFNIPKSSVLTGGGIIKPSGIFVGCSGLISKAVICSYRRDRVSNEWEKSVVVLRRWSVLDSSCTAITIIDRSSKVRWAVTIRKIGNNSINWIIGII